MTTVLLDGAMGTALLDDGLPAGALPEAWLVERPDRVRRVHADHAAAGAEIVLTCTFNLAGPRLQESGVDLPVEELARRAVRLARSAAPAARVAGAVGPTLLAGEAPRAELLERHERAYRALAAAGADLIWAESHWDLVEARAALEAARATGLPAVATFTFRDEGGVLRAASGESALECLSALARDGAAAVGTNCMLPGAPLEVHLARAAEVIRVPLVAKPSAGLPGGTLSPARFAAWSRALALAGARWIGGCCGTTADHLAAAGRSLQTRG